MKKALVLGIVALGVMFACVYGDTRNRQLSDITRILEQRSDYTVYVNDKVADVHTLNSLYGLSIKSVSGTASDAHIDTWV